VFRGTIQRKVEEFISRPADPEKIKPDPVVGQPIIETINRVPRQTEGFVSGVISTFQAGIAANIDLFGRSTFVLPEFNIPKIPIRVPFFRPGN